jgi:hypothetical protein
MLHAAQRARLPTIDKLTANRALQPGQETIAVSDLVDAMSDL